MRKDSGLVRDVFQQKHMLNLKGNVGIGHVRYPTAGRQRPRCPTVLREFTLRHVPGPQRQFDQRARTHRSAGARGPPASEYRIRFRSVAQRAGLRTASASARRASRPPTSSPPPMRFIGAAAAATRSSAMVIGHGILGFRDPNGIRPLVIGKRDTHKGTEWMLASESVALDMLGIRHGARRGAGRGGVHRRTGPLLRAAMRGDGAAHAVHFRVRVFRAAGFDHRQHFGVQGAAAHGRASGGEDQARAAESRHRCGHSDPRHQPHGRGAGGAAARREVPRGLHQEPLHRPHVHHAGPGTALEVGAQQIERHRSGIPRQDRAVWSTTPSCAAPPPRRSSTWHAKPVPRKCISRPRRRRSAIRTCTASTCRIHVGAGGGRAHRR